MDETYLVAQREGRWTITNDGTTVGSLPTLDDVVLAARLIASLRFKKTGRRGEVVVHKDGHLEAVFSTDEEELGIRRH